MKCTIIESLHYAWIKNKSVHQCELKVNEIEALKEHRPTCAWLCRKHQEMKNWAVKHRLMHKSATNERNETYITYKGLKYRAKTPSNGDFQQLEPLLLILSFRTHTC